MADAPNTDINHGRLKSATPPTRASDIFAMTPQNFVGPWVVSSGGNYSWTPNPDKPNGQGQMERLEEWGNA